MTSNYFTIDTLHSQVIFLVKKLGFLTVKGTLSDFTGEIAMESEAIDQANFNISIGASTVNTGTGKRDEHLKSKDFFHVNKHPKILFQSTSVRSTAKAYQVTGNLTLLGYTREVSIPFSYSEGVFKGEFSLNRLDYHLGEKFPAFFIGKSIQVSIVCKINKSNNYE